jgi:hypothetical protein
MVGFAVMRRTLFLMLGLAACGAGDIDASWAPIGPAQYAITDCRLSECYRAAAAACPYGYDKLGESNEVTGVSAGAMPFGGTAVGIHRDKTLRVQCRAPVFCDAAPCVYGYRCVVSHAYPGHNVCAI